jgi:putative GTP pyrophosphokinase
LDGLTKWYNENEPRYQILLSRITNLLEILLKREGIGFYQVQSRVKSFSRFEEKMVRKKYSTPEDMIDFLGIRIICYLVSDKELISGMISDNFQVVKMDDKLDSKDVDTFGYSNAIHMDVRLSDDRIILPEYEQFKDLKFEIQVTTILQHAWSAIEHDRNYKTGVTLPKEVERAFYRLSSILEECDKRFDEITRKIDDYHSEIGSKINRDEYDIPINSPSLRRYLFKRFGDIPDFKPEYGPAKEKRVIEQLTDMGIKTLFDFEKIIPPNFKERYITMPKSTRGTYSTGIVVWVLIIFDWKKYFTEAYKEDDGLFDSHDAVIFEEFGLDISKFKEVNNKVEFDCSGLL